MRLISVALAGAAALTIVSASNQAKAAVTFNFAGQFIYNQVTGSPALNAAYDVGIPVNWSASFTVDGEPSNFFNLTDFSAQIGAGTIASDPSLSAADNKGSVQLTPGHFTQALFNFQTLADVVPGIAGLEGVSFSVNFRLPIPNGPLPDNKDAFNAAGVSFAELDVGAPTMGSGFQYLSFDPTILRPVGGGSFEHVIGPTVTATSVSGSFDPLPPTPEPTTWALMTVGFGLAGAALRRRKEPAYASQQA